MPQADAVSIPGQSIHCTTCWAKLKRTDAVCPGCGKRIVTTVEQSDEPHTEGASPAESQLKPDEEASEGPSLASAVGESTRQEINKYTAVGFVDPGPYGLLKLARRRPYNPILHLRLAQKLRKAKKT
jgi:DNA-directed RNA polymerase subunit RPC12/RpoP